MAGSPSEAFLERFTERALQAMVLAEQEAKLLGSKEVDDPHVLLGLLREGEGLGARVLESLGITLAGARAHVIRIGSRQDAIPFEPAGDGTASWTAIITSRVGQILELALREALSLGHNFIGTEHLLLAIVRLDAGVSARALVALGTEPGTVRNQVIRMLSGPGSRGGSRKPPKRSPASEESSEEQGEQVEDEAPEAIPTHPDRPATRDELGRARLASVLAERMRRVRGEDTEVAAETWRKRRAKLRRDTAEARRAGSFMVHLHAPWGAGKSSLLNFLAVDLRNREQREDRIGLGKLVDSLFRRRRTANPQLSQWIVVEFSAWEHQRLTTPWWWLLAAIQRSCARELWGIHRGRWAWFWMRDIGWRLWNARAAVLTLVFLAGLLLIAWTLDWFGLEVESLTAAQTVILTVASAIALASTLWGLARGTGRWLAIGSAEGAVRFLRRAHDPLGVYRRRFRWLVRSSGRPITVFIDDLDRCKPSYVVELLEGIQTLFAAEPVTYVVAADRTWLCESFAQAYGEFQQTIGELGRPLGFLFLEKTFQISMEIPPMSRGDRERYWATLMRGDRNGGTLAGGNPISGSTNDAFAGAATQSDVEERVGSLLRSGADNEEVLVAAMRRLNAPDMQDQLERLLSEFAPMLENNPRSMKRMMNAYGVERDRLLRDGYLLTRKERKQLALLTILRLRWPEFSDHLRRCPQDAAYCVETKSPGLEDHPYMLLLRSPDVRALFNGSQVDEALNPEVIENFPDRAPG